MRPDADDIRVTTHDPHVDRSRRLLAEHPDRRITLFSRIVR